MSELTFENDIYTDDLDHLAKRDQELLNAIAALSMKLNKFMSECRQFEKQRFNPLRDKFDYFLSSSLPNGGYVGGASCLSAICSCHRRTY